RFLVLSLTTASPFSTGLRPRTVPFLVLMLRRPPGPPLFPYTTLFRSSPCRGSSRAAAPGSRGGRCPRPRRSRHRSRRRLRRGRLDRKSTRLNSSHVSISYAVFCLKKKKKDNH